jgi:hypothetical protein
MSTPRWYRENGNIYFANVGREGSLVWIDEEDSHTDERCDKLLVLLIDPSPRTLSFEWEDAK